MIFVSANVQNKGHLKTVGDFINITVSNKTYNVFVITYLYVMIFSVT